MSNEQFYIVDWTIGNFLKIVILIQALMLGLIVTEWIGLSSANSGFLIVRQAVGFIYLTFVPGVIILRILGLHYLGLTKATLYSVGLSLGFSMFIMLLMNAALPAFGVVDPLSSLHLTTILSISILLLCFVSFLKDKNFKVRDEVKTENISMLSVFTIILFPLLSVLGTFLATFYGINILLLLMLLGISSVAVLVSFGKVDSKLYPPLILGIAIALLFQISLVSNYLVGWDSHLEYFFFKSVETSSLWNPAISSTYNSMLSVVMLPVMYSKIMSIDGVWIIKIIYPLIYSLVPLGLYEVYRKQTNVKVAFLAVFFFMSVFTFFNEMPALGRQEISELFLVLLLLLMLDDKLPLRKRSLLFIFFGASMVVSHYGITYLYMICLISAWFFVSLTRKSIFTNFTQKLFAPFNRIYTQKVESEFEAISDENPENQTKFSRSISLMLLVFIFVFAFVWYTYISNSITFDSVINIGRNICNEIMSQFTVIESRGSSVLNVLGLSSGIIIRWDSRILLYITEFFVTVGIVSYLARAKKSRFTYEYGGMAIISITILIMTVVLPFLATSTLNISRILHFTTIFLAPFCIIGGATLSIIVLKLFRGNCLPRKKDKYIAFVLSIVLVLYFMFNIGFIYEIQGDDPSSIALSLVRMNVSNDASLKIWLHGEVDSRQDVFGASWLFQYRDISVLVYSDLISATHVLLSNGMIPKNDNTIMTKNTQISGQAYVYLGQLNVADEVMINLQSQVWNTSDLSNLLINQNLIYSNGAAKVYSQPNTSVGLIANVIS